MNKPIVHMMNIDVTDFLMQWSFWQYISQWDNNNCVKAEVQTGQRWTTCLNTYGILSLTMIHIVFLTLQLYRQAAVPLSQPFSAKLRGNQSPLVQCRWNTLVLCCLYLHMKRTKPKIRAGQWSFFLSHEFLWLITINCIVIRKIQ